MSSIFNERKLVLGLIHVGRCLSVSHKNFVNSTILIEWINDSWYGVWWSHILSNLPQYWHILPNFVQYYWILCNIGQIWRIFLENVMQTDRYELPLNDTIQYCLVCLKLFHIVQYCPILPNIVLYCSILCT